MPTESHCVMRLLLSARFWSKSSPALLLYNRNPSKSFTRVIGSTDSIAEASQYISTLLSDGTIFILGLVGGSGNTNLSSIPLPFASNSGLYFPSSFTSSPTNVDRVRAKCSVNSARDSGVDKIVFPAICLTDFLAATYATT